MNSWAATVPPDKPIRLDMDVLLSAAEADSMEDSELAGLPEAADEVQQMGETTERDA